MINYRNKYSDSSPLSGNRLWPVKNPKLKHYTLMINCFGFPCFSFYFSSVFGRKGPGIVIPLLSSSVLSFFDTCLQELKNFNINQDFNLMRCFMPAHSSQHDFCHTGVWLWPFWWPFRSQILQMSDCGTSGCSLFFFYLQSSSLCLIFRHSIKP